MSMLLPPQQRYPHYSSHHVHTPRHPLLPRHLCGTAAAATTNTVDPTKGPDQPQVMEAKLPTGLQLLTTRTSSPMPDDQSLYSTWPHRGWVASGCASVIVTLAKSSIASVASSQLWLEPVLAGFAGYALADLGSGIYHWGIDNYGNASTPLFGAQIEAFQGHHRQPWIITQREFANNLHALGQSVTFAVLPFDLLCSNPTLLAFAGVFSGCIMFSQQFHAWAHSKKRKRAPLVIALQKAGVLVSPKQHAAHHRTPYNNNYCIVSGMWNEFLDKHKVFEGLEMMLFFRLGLRPRSWSEPGSGWIEETCDTRS